MTPTAIFAYEWPLVPGEPPMVLYRISGGAYDGSDVTADTLVTLGIAVPVREQAAA
jgi:hypothetical protein